MNYSPLEQFEIKKLLIYHLYVKCPVFDVSITNGSITLLLILISYCLFNLKTIRSSYIVPNVWQFLTESLFSFISKMIGQQNTQTHALRFLPYIYTIFSLILFSNVLGLFPYAFTMTSHICVTFVLAFITFFGITFLGFYINKLNFIKFFIPSGVPTFLLAFLFCIEVISYFIRPFSLSIRLFANMLAGHTLLYILGNFAATILFTFPLIVSLAFIPLFLVFLLEFAIAFIQTYVFIILTCIYLNDIYNVGTH